MQQALLLLLEKKEFISISIRELCSAAEVNRSTFYAHYQNMSDLLEETHSEICRDFFGRFDKPGTSDRTMISPVNFMSSEYIIPYLQFIKENQKVFLAYSGSKFRQGQIDLFRLFLEKIFIPVFRQKGIGDEKKIAYYAHFYLGGLNCIVSEWVKNDCRETEQEIMEIMMRCTSVRGGVDFFNPTGI